MSDLMNYLIDNISATEEIEEVSLPGRLSNFTFRIKPAGHKELNKWREDCRTVKKKRVYFDDARFNELIITKCCVEPNFNDEGSIQKANCKTPSDMINKLLKAGEIQDLANEIMELSGFDADPDELVEEAKNS